MSVSNLGIDGLDHVEQIGTGGSSRVYRARQSDLDRVVAVKVINSGEDPDVARRFDRERKAMGRLSNHEGIVPVYSTGTTAHGEPYLMMPFYSHGSVQDLIDQGPLDWRQALDYIDRAAETMAAAHEAGVVHLDIKPANILLTANGAPRIADFGIAKLSSGGGVAARTTGTAFTPAYSAPETFLDGQATPAADVYGLGATLWACLVGHPPFLAPGDDTNLMAVIGRVVNNPLGDVRHLAPEPICQVITKAMAKDPINRYYTARKFSEALKQAMAEVGIGVDRAGAAVMPPVGSPRSDNTEVHQFTPPVPYGSGPRSADEHQTQVFADAAAPTVASARTISRGPALTTSQPRPAADYRSNRSLLQQSADPAHYQQGPAPIVERTPWVDLDRFRVGPVLAGLIALLGVGLLATWALTRDGSTPESGVASVSEESPPAGPDIDTDADDGADLSLTGSTDSSSSSTSSTTDREAASGNSQSVTSPPTTEATTTSETTTSTPSTPSTTDTGDIMTPENVAAAVEGNDVTVSWSAPADGPSPESYVVYRNGDAVATVDDGPYVDDDLAPGTYRYRIGAVDSAGNESELSPPVEIEVEPVPLNLTTSLANSGPRFLEIRVDSAPCMAAVRVSYVADGSDDDPEVVNDTFDPCVTSNTIRLAGLSPDTTYVINVTATGQDGGTGTAAPLRVDTR